MGKATFQDVFNGVTTYLGTYNLVNGVATFTTSALAVGSHAITATYSSDTDFFTSSSGTLLGGETVNPPVRRLRYNHRQVRRRLGRR